MITLLYFVDKRFAAERRSWLEQHLARETSLSSQGQLTYTCRLQDEDYTIVITTDAAEAQRRLDHTSFDALVVDDSLAGNAQSGPGYALLENLQYAHESERAFPLNRAFAIVSDDGDVARAAFRCGKLKVRDFFVNPQTPLPVLEAIKHCLDRVRPGKIALCLAGGGVEGLLYELGVCMALNDVLVNKTIHQFDIYTGISAGSILASFLAFGMDLHDLLHALQGKRNGILEPINGNILYDLAVGEALTHFWQTLVRLKFGSSREMVSLLFRLAPSGVFKGDRLKDYISRQYKRMGVSEDFRKANAELYIGATNQDTAEHVIFGWGKYADVPVSKAIRASCSLTPFYMPEKIGDTWYSDGQLTRTANVHFALQRGANFTVIVNPLRPIETGAPGYVKGKGGVFEALQSLKALINTRFLHALNHLIEKIPDVEYVVFEPYREDMKLMGGSPMKYGIRTEIVLLAYNATIRKINTSFDFYQSRFARHGVEIRQGRVLRELP